MNYTVSELYETLKNKKELDSGARGIVFINDEKTLLKVEKEFNPNMPYSDFVKNIAESKKRKSKYKMYEENQKKFMEKGKNLDFVDFAEDIVYLENMYIGVIIKWYKNCLNLMEYKYKDKEELIEVIRKIIENNRILIEKGIYHLDLLSTNILYDGKNMHIIDIDGYSIKYFPKKTTYYETLSYYSLFIGIEQLLTEKYGTKNNYCDYQEYETINYVKAKKLIKKVEQRGIFKE